MIYEFNGNLVDGLYYFYASWNSKCNHSMERLEKISRKYDMNIIKINTTKYPGLKTNFNVSKIPTYLYVVDGKVIKRIEGNVDYISLSKWIENL